MQAREAAISSNQKLALFAFDARGRLLTPTTSNKAAWDTVPDRDAAVRSVLDRNRFISGAKDGSAIVVGLGVHGGPARGLVAYSLRPELKTQLGMVRNEFSQSALIAFVLGAAAGLVVATFTGRRLARIADAARAIGGGDFSVRVADGFPDEVGSLASSLEEMREQLQGVFDVLHDDRDRLERLLDRLEEGVVLIRRDLTVEFANGRARELLGADLTASKLAQDVRRFAIDVFASDIPAQLRLSEDERTLLVSGHPSRSRRRHRHRRACGRVAARAGRTGAARVRDQCSARAPHAARIDRHCDRDAPDGREGRSTGRVTISCV